MFDSLKGFELVRVTDPMPTKHIGLNKDGTVSCLAEGREKGKAAAGGVRRPGRTKGWVAADGMWVRADTRHAHGNSVVHAYPGTGAAGAAGVAAGGPALQKREEEDLLAFLYDDEYPDAFFQGVDRFPFSVTARAPPATAAGAAATARRSSGAEGTGSDLVRTSAGERALITSMADLEHRHAVLSLFGDNPITRRKRETLRSALSVGNDVTEQLSQGTQSQQQAQQRELGKYKQFFDRKQKHYNNQL